MAFTLANWGCQQPSMNAGQETIVPYGGSSTVENTCNVFTYVSPNDTAATIIASAYFDSMAADLSVNDIIWGSGTDAAFAVQVTAVSPHVTVASMGLTTSIGTANILDDAVTYAKLQDAAAGGSLIGEPTSTPGAEYQEVGLGNGLDFASTNLELKPSYLNVVEVSLTAAQFNGMYATPVQVLASPGANKVIVIRDVVLNMTFVSASYAAGGAVGLQYGSSAHLAGAPASATEAATDFTAAAASTLFRFGGSLSTGALISASANTAVYISNATQAFTTGDGTFKVWISYQVLPTNS